MFDLEDMVKAAALRAMVDKMKDAGETQKKRASHVPHFESESEAVNYARRVATIKAGDVVKLPTSDGERLMEVVFTGTINTDNNCPQFLYYDAEDKWLGTVTASWHAIVL